MTYLCKKTACYLSIVFFLPLLIFIMFSALSHQLGVELNSEKYETSLPALSISNTAFYNYNNPCRPGNALSLSLVENGGNIIPNMDSRTSFNRLSFKNSPLTYVPFAPISLGVPFLLATNLTTDVNSHAVVKDVDGSLMGSSGFLVASNSQANNVAPGCVYDASFRMFKCPNTCYRSGNINKDAYIKMLIPNRLSNITL